MNTERKQSFALLTMDGKNGCLEKMSKNLNRKMLENIFEKKISIKISLTLADVSNRPAMQNETL